MFVHCLVKEKEDVTLESKDENTEEGSDEAEGTDAEILRQSIGHGLLQAVADDRLSACIAQASRADDTHRCWLGQELLQAAEDGRLVAALQPSGAQLEGWRTKVGQQLLQAASDGQLCAALTESPLIEPLGEPPTPTQVVCA